MIGKKAQIANEPLFIMWRMILLAAILLVVVSIVSNAFSTRQDIRPAESVILARATAECIAPYGKADQNFDLKNCINFDTNEYFLNASIVSLETNYSKSQSVGLSSIKTNCAIKEKGVKFLNSPVCAKSQSYILVQTSDGLTGAILSIEAGVGKVKQNV